MTHFVPLHGQDGLSHIYENILTDKQSIFFSYLQLSIARPLLNKFLVFQRLLRFSSYFHGPKMVPLPLVAVQI